MRAKILSLAAALALTVGSHALVGGHAMAANWQGDAEYAKQLVAARYTSNGVSSPQVTDTGRTFTAGGVVWRVFQVTWANGGFRHVAVHRQNNGEYLAIEGLEQSRKWSHGVPIGR